MITIVIFNMLPIFFLLAVEVSWVALWFIFCALGLKSTVSCIFIFCLSGILCVPTENHNYHIIPWGLKTPPWSVRGHAASMFFTGRPIDWMVCIIFLAIYRATLLVVDRRGIFYSLTYPDMAGMVIMCPGVGDFRRFSSFVDLFHHFQALKNSACLLVGISFKVPPLWVGSLFTRRWYGVYKDLV